MKAEEIQRQHFNKIGDTYVQARSNKYHVAYQKIWWNEYFSWLTDNLPKGKIIAGIDAMCGNAEVASYLVSKNPKIRMDAFDYSDEMVNFAKKDIKNRQVRVKVWKDDILHFSKDKNRYDFVVILGGLHHMPDYTKKVLSNINKMLRPGGYFLNLEPTQNNPLLKWARQQIYHNNPIFEESTERAFDLDNYNSYLKKAGFEITKQSYPGLIGYILFYNPDAFPYLNIPIMALTKLLARIDIKLGSTNFGKYWSFATWTLAKKK